MSNLFFSGCEIPNAYDFSVEEVKKLNQSQIEKQLIKGTKFENEQLNVIESVIITSRSLKQLKEELEILNNDIQIINEEIIKLESEQNELSNQETVEYLNYLNDLMDTSVEFTNSLSKSVNLWDKYLNEIIVNRGDLTKIKQINQTEFANSIVEPVKVFGVIDLETYNNDLFYMNYYNQLDLD